jgi:hypothetical protein
LVSQSFLVADLPCGATVSTKGTEAENARVERDSLMALVEAHEARCLRCRVFPKGIGGVVVSRKN